MESIPCDLCGQNQAQPVYTVTDTNYGTPGTFTIVQCQHCGLVYLNPRPSAAEIPARYPEAQYDPFRAAVTNQLQPGATNYERARWLTTQPGQVLEVGFGSGLFLKAMQELGWACYGVEPNPTATQFARERLKLEVVTGDIFAVTRQNFDLIAMWDVLEHTPSPRKNLQQAWALLKPQGRLALSFPNWESFERHFFKERWIALDAPRHFYHFSQATITRLLRECGFEILSLSATAPVMSLASNTLRWLGDFALRRGQAKAAAAVAGPTNAAAPPSPSGLKRLAVRSTYWALTPLNILLNALQRGPALTVLARKLPTAPKP